MLLSNPLHVIGIGDIFIHVNQRRISKHCSCNASATNCVCRMIYVGTRVDQMKRDLSSAENIRSRNVIGFYIEKIGVLLSVSVNEVRIDARGGALLV